MLNLLLKDKVVLITGGSKGIGYEIAKGFAKEKAKVFLVSRDLDNLKLSVAKLKKINSFVGYQNADVSKQNSYYKIFKSCEKKFGPVDILINNAGGPIMGTIFELSEKNWKSAIDTNMMSVIRFSRYALKSMKKKKWGRIISITSTVTKEPSPEMILSATARGGLSAFNKSICHQFAKYNITSNIISPGGVLTDRLKSLFKTKSIRDSKSYEEILENAQNTIPAKRFAEPNEIAKLVLFLCSQHGAYINGIDIKVDGGLTKSY